MSTMTSQIIGVTFTQNVCSGVDQRKHQSSASLACVVMGIQRWPMNSPHKGPVTMRMYPFDDVIMDTDVSSFLPGNGCVKNVIIMSEFFVHFNCTSHNKPLSKLMLIYTLGRHSGVSVRHVSGQDSCNEEHGHLAAPQLRKWRAGSAARHDRRFVAGYSRREREFAFQTPRFS